jgi:flavin reductase
MQDVEISTQMFRDGMARLGSSVNVITSDGPSGRLGFTATSVCSLSDSPPSLIVCMNRSSTQNVLFKANGVLCVNVLAPEHRDLSAAFAGVGRLDSDRRFAIGAWSSLKTGAPVLEGAVAAFDCRIKDHVEASTHTILICDVVGLSMADTSSSLIYFMREYHRLVLPDPVRAGL